MKGRGWKHIIFFLRALNTYNLHIDFIHLVYNLCLQMAEKENKKNIKQKQTKM